MDRDDKGRVVIETNTNSEPAISNYERVKRYCHANGVYDPAVIQSEFLKWYPTNGTGR